MQIPLTRVSSLFSLGTCFLVWFIDTQTKADLYHFVTFICRVPVNPRLAWRNWRRTRIVEPLPLMDLQNARTASDSNYTKKERDILKNIVDWVCLNVILFKAVMLNFLLGTFLHDMTATFTQSAVHYMDNYGFEGHFIRFI